MFKIALVMFRELLEISVLLGIIGAATKSLKKSSIYITAGVMLGVLGASLLALSINHLCLAFGGLGEEIVDIIIIILTVLTVAITALWVNDSAKKLYSQLESISSNAETIHSKALLISVIALTIFREGTEIVLFVHAIISTNDFTPVDYALGLATGIIAGVMAGIAVYKGLNRLNRKYLFKISFVFLTLIAASLASEAAGKMTSIGLINLWTTPVWDSTWLLSDTSITGRILKILVGYNSRPSGIQILLYFSTIGLVYACAKLLGNKKDV